jgi:hypothetical protein
MSDGSTYTDGLGIIYSLEPVTSYQGYATVIGYTENVASNLVIPDIFYYDGFDYYVKAIADGAFNNCAKLETVVIVCENVKEYTFGQYAFKGCSTLFLVQFYQFTTTLTLKENAFSEISPDCEAYYYLFPDDSSFIKDLSNYFKTVTDEAPDYSYYPPNIISVVSNTSSTTQDSTVTISGINFGFNNSVSFGDVDDPSSNSNLSLKTIAYSNYIVGTISSSVLETSKNIYIRVKTIADPVNNISQTLTYTFPNPLYNVISLTQNISANFTNNILTAAFKIKHFNIIGKLNLKKLSGSIKFGHGNK